MQSSCRIGRAEGVVVVVVVGGLLSSVFTVLSNMDDETKKWVIVLGPS